jgi:dipeptidyl aminopeptidase/acylaminoacyl peptidase
MLEKGAIAAVLCVVLSGAASAQPTEGRGYALVRVTVADRSALPLLSNPEIVISELSPDRSRVAYTAQGRELWIAHVDGSNPMLIASGPLDGRVAWSPDARFIAYQRYVYAGGAPPSSEIWLARSDGTQPRLVATGADAPVWSPDSTRLAYAVRQGQSATEALGVIGLEGSDARILGPAEEVSNIAWSPNGERIAYKTGQAAVRIVDVATTRSVVMRNADQPTWIDAAHLAFTRFGGTLVVARSDGTHARRLDTAFRIARLAYSARSESIAYVRSAWSPKNCCSAQINVLRLASGKRRVVTHEPRDTIFEHLWWALSGKAFFYARRPPQSGE